MRVATPVVSLFLAALALLPAAVQATAYGVAHRSTAAQPAPLAAPFASFLQDPAPTISVFPNPARGLVSVQLTAQHGPDYKLRLSNVLGREVRLLPLPLATASLGVPLDLSGLPAGLYFCSLLVNDKAVSTNRLTVL